MSAPDPDRLQRQAADGAASVWVAASAGTGKTKVLTDRVLALLLRGSPPSRILCLTFTKAAAAEMANRIGERLSRWATTGDGRLAQELAALTGRMPDAALLAHARRLFARVLDAPGGMRIETIHAFCQSLLRRFPVEAGVPPHFEVMDERSAGELLAAAREEVLGAARSGADAGLAEALAEVARHVPEQGFTALMSELVGERGRFARCRAAGGGHDGFLSRLRAVLDLEPGVTVEGLLAEACAEGGCDAAGLSAAVEALMASDSDADRARGEALAAWLADPASRVAGLEEYVGIYFTQKGERRKVVITRRAAAAAPAAAAALDAEAARLERFRARHGAALLLQATGALVRLADALLCAYEGHKAARALLDFDDLVLRTRTLLERPGVAPWVLFKLDGGLDHILIDEAQDTNPDQWDIVRILAEEFFSGEGARPETRTIFAVGDAKQSIYSFQRADPQHFHDMRQYFAERIAAAGASWRVVDLDISFRSTAAVLTAVDAVFVGTKARDGVERDDTAIRHETFRVGQAGLVELWPPVEPAEPASAAPWELPVTQRPAREPRARLAQALALTLRRWLDDPEERLPSRDRRVTAGDVMVLVRRRGPFVGELVRALKQADVAVAGADRMLLTDQLAVQDLMALGQFLLLPEDDLTLATILKGPLYGIGEEMLFDLAHGRTGSLWSELRRRAAEPALHHAASELAELLKRADFVPPYEFFAEVLGARGARRAVLARLGPEAADPLDEFLSTALAYERDHVPSLQGFLHWLALGEAVIKRDFGQRGRDEVRILTVHGAKGLQAPIVILPDTLQVPIEVPRLLWTAKDAPAVTQQPAGPPLPLWAAHRGCAAPLLGAAREEAQRRRDREYRRLLYVALTRAEDRLYVCGWHTKQAPAEDCWYHLVRDGLAPVAERVAIDLTAISGAEGWCGTGLRLVGRQTATPRADDSPLPLVEEERELPPWAVAPPPTEPRPARPLAPSRPRLADPAARSPLGADRGVGFRRGRLAHRLLQSLPELPPASREAAARRFLARPVHGLAPGEGAALLREVLAVLDEPEFRRLFGPGSQAEVPVVGLLGDYALSGQIDRLLVTPEAVLIVDYKTLRPPPVSEDAIPVSYLDQLAAYRAAVAAVYPGREVRCALLWTDGPRLMPVSPARLAAHLP